MSSIVVQAFMTLDGVVQGCGGAYEDREGGFDLGGWQMQYDDRFDTLDEGGAIIAGWERMNEGLLLGRKTYDIWSGYWPLADENEQGLLGDLIRRYNRVPKYVASRTLTEVGWQNAELLGPDVPAAIARLRSAPGGEIHVWGSTELVKTLAEHDLVDEYRIALYPIVLGTGKKLFSAGFTLSTFTVVQSRALASGVVITTYRPAVGERAAAD